MIDITTMCISFKETFNKKSYDAKKKKKQSQKDISSLLFSQPYHYQGGAK